MELVPAALRFIATQRLLPPDRTVICAVSGGIDSMALLDFLDVHRHALHIQLQAAHLHHQIEEARSDEAEACVRAFAAARGLVCHVRRVDVPGLGRRAGMGIEAAGRRARMRWFRRLAMKSGAIVVTAHTADDQAETVLMRLLRGAGPRGLRGVLPLLERDGRAWLARPLLACTREQTRQYVEARGLPIVDDPTNADPAYNLRNRIRARLLPLLTAEYNPSLVAALCRTADAAREDCAALDRMADEAANRCLRHTPDRILLAADIATLPAALRKRLYRAALETAGAEVNLHALERLDDLMLGRPERRVHATFQARRGANGVEVERAYEAPPAVSTGPIAMAVPGETRFNGWVIRAARVEGHGHTSPRRVELADGYRAAMRVPWSCAIAADASHLSVRGRIAGDRWRPPKGSGSCKLKATLNAWRVPRPERDAVPIIAVDEKIACVPGYGPDERFRPHSEVSTVIQIETVFEG